MARLQVEQKSWLASKSSKSFCSSGGIIRIGSPQRCRASRTSILPNFWPSSNARNALTTFSRPSTMSSRYLYQYYQVYPVCLHERLTHGRTYATSPPALTTLAFRTSSQVSLPAGRRLGTGRFRRFAPPRFAVRGALRENGVFNFIAHPRLAAIRKVNQAHVEMQACYGGPNVGRRGTTRAI
jgi:hypothetical protein